MRIIKINLIPKKPGMKMPKIPWGPIIGIVILVAAGWFMWGFKQRQFDEEIDRLTKEQKSLSRKVQEQVNKKKEELAELNKQIAIYENKVQLIEDLVDCKKIVPWTEVMETLTKVVPRKKVWVTIFNCDPKYKLDIQGSGVDTVKNISEFITNLKNEPTFTDIFLNNAVKKKVNQQEIWDFKISCSIKKKRS